MKTWIKILKKENVSIVREDYFPKVLNTKIVKSYLLQLSKIKTTKICLKILKITTFGLINNLQINYKKIKFIIYQLTQT